MRRASGAERTALCGLCAAGSLVFLLLACVAPSGRMGLTAVAGLFPVAAVLRAGASAGYLTWIVSGLLGIILLPDKGVGLLYLLFLGLYPVVKGNIESLRRLPLEWVLKFLYFNVALAVCWFGVRSLFLPDVPEWLGTPLLFAGGNVVFFVYDIGLSRIIGLLRVRLGHSR